MGGTPQGGVFDARNLRAMFSMGVPVSFRGVSTYGDGAPVLGLFDRPITMKLEQGGIGGVETAIPELRLPFNAFQIMPQDGDLVFVNGATYSVTQPTTEDDGAVLVYELLLTQ